MKRWIGLLLSLPALFVLGNATECDQSLPLLDKKGFPDVEMIWKDSWGHELAHSLSLHFFPEIFRDRGPFVAQVLLQKAEIGKSDLAATYARYGFKFTQVPDSDRIRIEIPSRLEFVARAEKRLQEHLQNKRLDPSDILRVGVAYELNGEIGCISAGSSIPRGAKPLSAFGRPDVFFTMTQHGYFPMESDGLLDQHEVNHVIGLTENPDYMKRISKFLRNPPVKGRDLRIRIFHAFEGLSLVPAGQRDRLQKILSAPFHGAGSNGLVTTDQVHAYYDSQGIERVVTQTRNLLRNFHTFAEHYGAMGRDDGKVILRSDSEASDSLPYLYRDLRLQLATFEKFPGRIDKADLVEALSRLEVGLWESSQITVDQFFDGLSEPKPSISSPLYRMFVKSRLGLRHSFGGRTVRSLMHYSISGDAEAAPKRQFTRFGNERDL